LSHKIIATESAPGAVGPYSQAILSGGLLVSAGQIGLDPSTGSLVEGGVEEQARQVLRNLRAVLAAAEMEVGDVLKTTIYLLDMEDFEAVNGVYGEVFGEVLPARSTVAVAGLPLGALVEIDLIARSDSFEG